MDKVLELTNKEMKSDIPKFKSEPDDILNKINKDWQ